MNNYSKFRFTRWKRKQNRARGYDNNARDTFYLHTRLGRSKLLEFLLKIKQKHLKMLLFRVLNTRCCVLLWAGTQFFDLKSENKKQKYPLHNRGYLFVLCINTTVGTVWFYRVYNTFYALMKKRYDFAFCASLIKRTSSAAALVW